MKAPVIARHALLLAALLLAAMAHAEEPLVFKDTTQEARFYDLTQELRCLVCQNQNLADSDAPLAHDLRKEIWEMMQAGKSDDQIKTYLVDRYGDFVLYQPPIKSNTLALYAYVRWRGYSPVDAQDLTQEFFARFLERESFTLADPTRGRFRTFLLKSLQHFLADDWKRSQRVKRGGGTFPLPLDTRP